MKKLLIPILCLFIYTCDSGNDNPTGPSGDGGSTGGSDGGSEDVYPNIVLTDIDYVRDNPYGYLQFTTLRVQNTGNGSSSDNEYRIRPCISYTHGGFNGTFTHNFSEEYLPSLSPGEYYITQTNNEQIVNSSVPWWQPSADCIVIY